MSNESLIRAKDDCYYIGVDGGGTKTEFVMFSEHGVIEDRLLLGGCNPNSVGIDNSINVLRTGINIFLSKKNNVKGVFIGASGMASGDHSNQIKEWFSKEYKDIKVDCCTDILNVIYSCENEDKCIAIIAGTGLVLNTYISGKLNRMLGWGYLFEEGGSGYNIGRDAVCAALSEDDGIGEHTCITPLIEEKTNCAIWKSLPQIYKRDSSCIASFAPIVFKAFEAGDKVAAMIINKNAGRIADIINMIIEEDRSIKNVIISGSLFTTNTVYLNAVKNKVKYDAKFIVPSLPQIYGACVMCSKMCGVDYTALSKSFKSEYAKYLDKGGLK